MKILVWGIGKETQYLIEKGMLSVDNIDAFIDSYNDEKNFFKRKVYRPEDSEIRGAACRY